MSKRFSKENSKKLKKAKFFNDEEFCLCGGPDLGDCGMIQCNQCTNFFHGKCIGLSDPEIDRLEAENILWYCPVHRQNEDEDSLQMDPEIPENADVPGKEKDDPHGFREAVISGLENAKDLDQISEFLDAAGDKLDYRRYGEVLFDILVAGGVLVPGGSISQDGEKPYTSACIFGRPEDMESMREQEQIFIKLVRRYKFLEEIFEGEMKKVLGFIKGLQPIQRVKLARMTALWIGSGFVTPQVLSVLNNEHLIKDGVALEFLLELFATLKQERGTYTLIATMEKCQFDLLKDFSTLNQLSEENLQTEFAERGLDDIFSFYEAKETKLKLEELILAGLCESTCVPDDIKEMSAKYGISEKITLSIKKANCCLCGLFCPLGVAYERIEDECRYLCNLIVNNYERRVVCINCIKDIKSGALIKKRILTYEESLTPKNPLLICQNEGCDYRCFTDRLLKVHEKVHQITPLCETALAMCGKCNQIFSSKGLPGHLKKCNKK